LVINLFSNQAVTWDTKVTNRIWLWLITPEIQLANPKPQPIFLPFSTLFFTCVGLNASWAVAKKGSWQLLLLLTLATALGVLQNGLGIGLAKLLGQSPLLGVICGSLTLTGGPSTAIGFANEFENLGFAAAGTVGAASAMFGIVAASILGGAFGTYLIGSRKIETQAGSTSLKTETTTQTSWLVHILILLLCVKLGAWVGYFLTEWRLVFPVYIGAMLVAVAIRNAFDLAGKSVIDTDRVNRIAGVLLGIFLSMAMASLNLIQLKSLAGPMLVILSAQVVLVLIFARGVTYFAMGKDYNAAVVSAGHVGFGLGITPNAVATMDVLTDRFGPATRAVLCVTIVGAFLIDFTNAWVITLTLNLLK
jgi:glutamate:Na+ symporter, ESS family